MKDNKVIIVCPCCETKLWIDKETGGLLKYAQPEKEKKSLEGLFNKYKEHKRNHGEAFHKAFEDEEKRKKLIHKKFKQALENVDELEDPHIE